MKISYGQNNIGKIQIYDNKGKRLAHIGNGKFKSQTDIQFNEDNIWVGVQAKYEENGPLKGLGIKTAKFE